MVGLIDHRLVDARPWGRDELHDRWYVHLLAPKGLPDTWEHGESDPSDRDHAFIRFAFSWASVDDDLLDAWHDHACIVRQLRTSL